LEFNNNNNKYYVRRAITDMLRLTTETLTKKWIFRRFRHCTKVVE